jgi:hypothetical protein
MLMQTPQKMQKTGVTILFIPIEMDISGGLEIFVCQVHVNLAMKYQKSSIFLKHIIFQTKIGILKTAATAAPAPEIPSKLVRATNGSRKQI